MSRQRVKILQQHGALSIKSIMLHHNPQKTIYGNCSKISNTFHFQFSTKLLIIRAGIHKMLVRIANSKDLDLGLSCLYRPFSQETSVHNFGTFTVALNQTLNQILQKQTSLVRIGSEMLIKYNSELMDFFSEKVACIFEPHETMLK